MFYILVDDGKFTAEKAMKEELPLAWPQKLNMIAFHPGGKSLSEKTC